jgi:hypothetical protein
VEKGKNGQEQRSEAGPSEPQRADISMKTDDRGQTTDDSMKSEPQRTEPQNLGCKKWELTGQMAVSFVRNYYAVLKQPGIRASEPRRKKEDSDQ